MPIVEARKADSKVFVLPIKIQAKRDVMQETFSLFHSRDTATDRPVTSRGEGGGRLTFTELSSSNHTISSSSPGPPPTTTLADGSYLCISPKRPHTPGGIPVRP